MVKCIKNNGVLNLGVEWISKGAADDLINFPLLALSKFTRVTRHVESGKTDGRHARRTNLGVIFLTLMHTSHVLQPGLSQLWRARVGLGQTVLKIYQDFWDIIVFLRNTV